MAAKSKAFMYRRNKRRNKKHRRTRDQPHHAWYNKTPLKWELLIPNSVNSLHIELKSGFFRPRILQLQACMDFSTLLGNVTP